MRKILMQKNFVAKNLKKNFNDKKFLNQNFLMLKIFDAKKILIHNFFDAKKKF